MNRRGFFGALAGLAAGAAIASVAKSEQPHQVSVAAPAIGGATYSGAPSWSSAALPAHTHNAHIHSIGFPGNHGHHSIIFPR